MKKIFIILILFLFACEELEEQTTPLSGIFYVFEGWNEFMKQDYDRAKELFSATLLADEGSETNYYDYAYAGLGWTAIYKANVNPGIDNRTLRENLRIEAIDHFESADAGVQLRLEAGDMSSLDSLLYANVMAGIVFNTGYLALDKAMEFYSDGSDNSVWSEALNYSQLVISFSDTLLNKFDDYDFEYDENINVDDIRLLRAQSFIRLNNSDSDEVDYLDSAAVEIELITDISCDLSQISVVECLHSSGLNP
ncbi:MAG: hypothetical protein H8E72_06110 [Candidatus Marinimicrobia bacterium]|nr:hypothetical protein [Candidatus Neomarinimicrobiota bacterium]